MLTAEAELRRLLDIMAALRDPVRGCPWDRQQSFDTIAPYTIEEAYEVADVIARRDLASLPNELIANSGLIRRQFKLSLHLRTWWLSR